MIRFEISWSHLYVKSSRSFSLYVFLRALDYWNMFASFGFSASLYFGLFEDRYCLNDQFLLFVLFLLYLMLGGMTG